MKYENKQDWFRPLIEEELNEVLLLNKKIKEVDADLFDRLKWIFEQIRDLPEISEVSNNNGLRFEGFAGPSVYGHCSGGVYAVHDDLIKLVVWCDSQLDIFYEEALQEYFEKMPLRWLMMPFFEIKAEILPIIRGFREDYATREAVRTDRKLVAELKAIALNKLTLEEKRALRLIGPTGIMD